MTDTPKRRGPKPGPARDNLHLTISRALKQRLLKANIPNITDVVEGLLTAWLDERDRKA